MQSLKISQSTIETFELPLIKSFKIAGETLSTRAGLYLNVSTADGISVKSEASPLPGVSKEDYKKAKHDLQQAQEYLKNISIPLDQKTLLKIFKEDVFINQLVASVQFALCSALSLLVAKTLNQSLVEFLGGNRSLIQSSGLLQGSFDIVIAEAKDLISKGILTLKLKVGDRNIPLDVKKVTELRKILPKEGLLRLDGNRTWSFEEAILFVSLAGTKQIEFIEEPLSAMDRLGEFYEKTHMPVALDESLRFSRCGSMTPGRCAPSLAQHEAVKAYVLKPTVMGFVQALEWIKEAKIWGKKAIISSSFESSVGIEILEELAMLTEQTPGLGTARFFKI